ncbi:MAG: YdiU family protein [Cellvibrio sp.]
MATSWSGLKFDNRFTRELPADAINENFRRPVTGALYSRVQPTPVSNPRCLSVATNLAKELGFDDAFLSSNDFTAFAVGNQLLEGMDPHSTVYGGHQFGQWAGQLGDGRAINLGEVVKPDGGYAMLQLKGAGPTPYSRTADGLAVLRSSLREYICSEAMHYLGVPTTRALSLATTGESVVRDMFYDGNPQPEPGAVVCRVAPSFIRFGHFELPAARQDITLLRQFAEFTIRHYFSDLLTPEESTGTAPLSAKTLLAFYQRVVSSTAQLINEWMRVGFVHGVLNTDNLSIHGLTIDYGPYGWLEAYDESWTPNTTDFRQYRYAFGNQPKIGLWNLAQLGNSLYPLIKDVDALQSVLNSYIDEYSKLEQQRFRDKLGLLSTQDTDEEMFKQLTQNLGAGAYDYTLFFRMLGSIEFTNTKESIASALKTLKKAQYEQGNNQGADEAMHAWLSHYAQRLDQEYILFGRSFNDRKAAMNQVNPKYIFRNYMAIEAIEALERGDDSLLNMFMRLIERPYDEQPEMERYFDRRPSWADDKPGCSSLSCSS